MSIMRKNTRWIMGKNCIAEVMKSAPERIIRIFAIKEDPLFKSFKKEKIAYISKQKLTDLVHSESHQGIAAQVVEKEMLSLCDFCKSLQDKERSIVLMLDSIFDPQNFGALLRAAECFGVDGVIYSKNRGCDLTPVVAKASVGASELIPLVKVSNLAEAAEKLKENGFWTVCTSVEPDAQPIDHFTYPEKTLLIMGSEGKGIQRLLLKRADFKVYIPMLGNIDSLNVSQATAVFLSKFTR